MIRAGRRDPAILAWVAGLGLAALIYLVGPDHFLFRLEDTLHLFAWRVAEAIAELSATALDVVRALAIGLFVTFLVLAVAVVRRGGHARGAAIVVTVVFALLVGGAEPGAAMRWFAAMVLCGIAASVMTGRLRQVPPALPAR